MDSGKAPQLPLLGFRVRAPFIHDLGLEILSDLLSRVFGLSSDSQLSWGLGFIVRALVRVLSLGFRVRALVTVHLHGFRVRALAKVNLQGFKVRGLLRVLFHGLGSKLCLGSFPWFRVRAFVISIVSSYGSFSRFMSTV
jgi:hypothetical protein